MIRGGWYEQLLCNLHAGPASGLQEYYRARCYHRKDHLVGPNQGLCTTILAEGQGIYPYWCYTMYGKPCRRTQWNAAGDQCQSMNRMRDTAIDMWDFDDMRYSIYIPDMPVSTAKGKL